MVYTEAQKRAIYKYRERNKETIKEYTNEWNKRQYYLNPEPNREYARKRYRWKKICKEFRDILIEEII